MQPRTGRETQERWSPVVETANLDANGRRWLTGGYFEHVLDGTIRGAKSKERGRRSVRGYAEGRALCVGICLHATHEQGKPILFFERTAHRFATRRKALVPSRLRQTGEVIGNDVTLRPVVSSLTSPPHPRLEVCGTRISHYHQYTLQDGV